MRPLAAHELRTTNLPLQARGALSRGGSRDIMAVAPSNAALLAGWPRWRGVVSRRGALRRRQRHKVSSKDCTKEQRDEMRLVSLLSPIMIIPFLVW